MVISLWFLLFRVLSLRLSVFARAVVVVWLVLALTVVVLLFLLLGLVKACEVCAIEEVHRLLLHAMCTICMKLHRAFATLVHSYYLASTLCRNGLEIGCKALVGGVGDDTCKDVLLEEVVIAVSCLQHSLAWWHLLASIHIVVHLIIEATIELGAHSSQLLRIERDVLEACCCGGDAGEILHPCGAAEFASARSGAADASSFLSGTYLFHLDAHMESGCKVFDELAEIHAFVRNIVEYCLVAIALLLHVAYLHLQSESLGYLSALYHCGVFACL